MSAPLKRAITNLKAESGFEFVSDTVARNGNFEFLIVTADAVIAAITLVGSNGTANTMVGATFKAGASLPIRFTSIQLTSGQALLVNRIGV